MTYQTFNYIYQRAYALSVEFNTIIDETFSGREQRRDTWTNPRHKWVLEFDKDNADMNSIMSFFIARKGKKEAFQWQWKTNHPVTGESMGGDGNTYLVRFDTDKLDFKMLEMGFSTFSIPLVEVFN